MNNKITWDYIEFWKDEGFLICHTLHSKQWLEIYDSVIDLFKCSAITISELQEITTLAKLYTEDKNSFLIKKEQNDEN